MDTTDRLNLLLRRQAGLNMRSRFLRELSRALGRIVSVTELSALDETDRAWSALATAVPGRLGEPNTLAVAIRDPGAADILASLFVEAPAPDHELLLFRPGSEYVGAVRVTFGEAVANLSKLTEEDGASFVLSDASADHALVVEACSAKDCGQPEIHVVVWPDSWAKPARSFVRSLTSGMRRPLPSSPSLNRSTVFPRAGGREE